MRFSVFLPVRNGGNYLRQCVTSILEQTYPDFQLIVLDNASSDGSAEWISSLNEPRVTLVNSATPLSIQDSWGRILRSPKGEFMTMIGHDDLLDKNYLETMCTLIGRHPDASLYQTHFRLIDSGGKQLRPCRPMPERETAAGFLESRMLFQRDSYGTGYMFRSSDYERVGGIPGYEKLLFADDALWMKLMLGSWKATAKEECFSYRVHSESTSFAPESRSLYGGLDQYLVFLQEACSRDSNVADVAKRLLATYLTTIYGWRYFPARRDLGEFNRVGEALSAQILQSAQMANNVLRAANAMGTVDIPDVVRHKVLSSRAYYSWYLRGQLGKLNRKLVGLLTSKGGLS